MEVVRNLWIEQVVCMSEEDEEVSKHIPGIRVGWVRVKLPAEYEMIRDEIKRMIESVIARLRESGLLRMPIEAVNRKVLVRFDEERLFVTCGLYENGRSGG